MMKLQESVLSVVRSSPLSAGVKSYLQDGHPDRNLLGGILRDTRLGWLAVGPKLCVLELQTGQKVGAWTFGATLSLATTITCVCELPTPLADNTRQLVVSMACEDAGGLICIFHCNGSQVLRCIQTEAVVTQLSVAEGLPSGPLECCDSLLVAGTDHGELLALDLNRAGLVQALKNSSQGYDHLIKNEQNMANLAFLSLEDITLAEEQREIALQTDEHLAINLNDQSYLDGEFIFRNPDGTVRMKAKQGHVKVTTLLYVSQLGSVIVGYNFGGFQIWNLMTASLEYTSPVNVECLPVTHFGFQEPCDDPRAFCYLWVTYSASGRHRDEEFPLAVMYSLTYQGKAMLPGEHCLYREFSGCTLRFQLELSCPEGAGAGEVTGGRCIACHTYSIPSSLQSDGDESALNICQLVWECWADNRGAPEHYTTLLFDLDQWYKDQMPESWRLQNSAFMCVAACSAAYDLRLVPASLAQYSHAHRLEEHFYPNSLQYSCVCFTGEDTSVLWTAGVQRQLLSGMDEAGPSVLLHPAQLYRQCVAAGLTPLLADRHLTNPSVTDQRKFLLSVALDGRLTQFLKKCARHWAGGSHSGAGCTLQLLVEWCWERALVLKRNARDLMRALDRNAFRYLEHCVRQLTQLASLLDAIVTKCCSLVVPDALSDIEERCKAIGIVATYFQVVQWFLEVGLLPEGGGNELDALSGCERLPYPRGELAAYYQKRRIKLRCLDGSPSPEESVADTSCSLLYIDQLIEKECGGDLIHSMWRSEEQDGSAGGALYPPPSLHALLRVYLLPDVSIEHKHSLVLYLLLDFSTTFGDVRYEAVIRRLMQFPTMFGLSNTAIKATQAFWHLDHRDFDFALDQLQCLTGSALAEWQHGVALSALLAQKRTQAALQYMHARRAPAGGDWRARCELYLARRLALEALDAVRLRAAASPAERTELLHFLLDGCKRTGQLSQILQISLLPFEEETLVAYLQAGGEECADILVMYYLQQARYIEAQRYNNMLRHSSSRPTERERAAEVAAGRGAVRDALVELECASLPRVAAAVAGACNTLAVSTTGATPRAVVTKPMSVFVQAKSPDNTFVYKSSFIQNTIESASETWVRRPQMTRGIKRALEIEDTPFICTPKLSRKSHSVFDRSEESSDMSVDGLSSPKRARFESAERAPSGAGTPAAGTPAAALRKDVQAMLDIPQVERVPDWKIYSKEHMERSVRDSTPQSILKVRRQLAREGSPTEQHFTADTDDEFDASSCVTNLTHGSDAASKHLRFAIPSSSSSSPLASEGQQTAGQTPPGGSPVDTSTAAHDLTDGRYEGTTVATPVESWAKQKMSESPVKKVATDGTPAWKPYKDNVRGRSFSISANSSLNDDPHTSIESIADIPVMLINPRYSAEGSYARRQEKMAVDPMKDESPHYAMDDTSVTQDICGEEKDDSVKLLRSNLTSTPRTPRSRPSIKSASARIDSPASITTILRSQSHTPERESIFGSPYITSAISSPRVQWSRSRSITPELKGKSPTLESIPEVLKEQDPDKDISCKNILTTPKKPVEESLEVIMESPSEVQAALRDSTSCSSGESSPPRRSQRSRSKTPDVEIKPAAVSPRMLRGRSKTPERESKLGSPKLSIEKCSKSRKPLSRLVLEANTFTKINKANLIKSDETEMIQSLELINESVLQDPSDSVIENTPIKSKSSSTMANYEFSPIVNKSILSDFPDSNTPMKNKSDSIIANYEFSPVVNKSILCDFPDSISSTSPKTPEVSVTDLTPPKSGTPFSTTFLDKSVLGGYRSSITASDSESNSPTELDMIKPDSRLLEYSASQNDPLEFGNESVSKDVSTRVTAESAENSALTDDLDEPSISEGKREVSAVLSCEISSIGSKKPSSQDIETEKQKIVEIEREITEIEDGMSDDGFDNRSNQENSNEDSDDSDDEEEDSNNEEGSNSESDSEDKEQSEEDGQDQELDDSFDNVAHKAVEDLEVISLVDSGDEDKGTPPKKKCTSPSSQSSDSFTLQIDIGNNDEIHQKEIKTVVMETNSEESQQNEKNVAAQLNESFSESNKDCSGLMDQEDDPFMAPDSEIDKQSDTEVAPKSINVETSQQEESNTAMDAFNDGNYSLMTEDNSVLDTDRSDMDVAMGDPETNENEKTSVLNETQEEATKTSLPGSLEKSVVETETNVKSIMPATSVNKIKDNKVEVASVIKVVVTSTDGMDSVEIESIDVLDNVLAPAESTHVEKQVQLTTFSDPITSNIKPIKAAINPMPRKRTRSTDSIISEKSNRVEDNSTPELAKEPEQVSLPSTSKKRTSSVKSNRSDKVTSPKTPTRRGSREKTDNLDESIEATPLRRSTRQTSKLSEDDNVSVVSAGSAKSTRSKSSKIENESVKSAGSARKSRRSILTITKPDLSVIPEDDSGNSRAEDVSQMIQEYSSTRRLTRHQRSLLEKSMEPPRATPRAPRRPSASSSLVSLAGSEHSSELEEGSVKSELFHVQPIDPISLLNKKDFDGPLDIEEELNFVAEQTRDSSDVTEPKKRAARSASETGSIKTLKQTRRMSADLERVLSPALSLDGSLTGSPGRPRRTSFNKALEALSTPKKSRRLSSDEGDTDSLPESPRAGSSKELDVTPARRLRRISSAKSDVLTTPRTPARRTRRNSSIAESKDDTP